MSGRIAVRGSTGRAEGAIIDLISFHLISIVATRPHSLTHSLTHGLFDPFDSIEFMINAINAYCVRRSKVTAFARRPPDRSGQRRSRSTTVCGMWVRRVGRSSCPVVFPGLDPITDSV
jgi:hypothetical protein